MSIKRLPSDGSVRSAIGGARAQEKSSGVPGARDALTRGDEVHGKASSTSQPTFDAKDGHEALIGESSRISKSAKVRQRVLCKSWTFRK
jgi:hypothetical protein